MMKRVWNRVYSDFLMPSRLKDYAALLNKALQHQYNVCSVAAFWSIYKTDKLDVNKTYLILRHDIDTDVLTAKAMFNIEKELGVNASYFFRLSTIDIPFMQMLHVHGSEASYHYEEIATYAKVNQIKNQQNIYSNLSEIKNMFANNLTQLRNETGLPMHTVASHGDFVNRYLRIPNHELLKDTTFRSKLGIELEVYDERIMCLVTSRYSDTGYPQLWKPKSPSPFQAIENSSRVIYLLTHPRHWRANLQENLKDNIGRIVQGIRYKMA